MKISRNPIGSLVGDIIGSSYEFTNPPLEHALSVPLFNNTPVNIQEDNTIICKYPSSRFTDDTVLTIASANALRNDPIDFAAKYAHFASLYPDAGYGSKFKEWVKNFQELGVPAQAYNSWGNGAPMRVSPIGWLAPDLDTAWEWAKASAEVTHNHPDAVLSAQIVACAIRIGRTSPNRDESVKWITALVNRYSNYDITTSVADRIKIHNRKFDVSAAGCTPIAIHIALYAESWDQALRWCFENGGDIDTIAAIMGSILETLIPVPNDIRIETLKRLDEKLTYELNCYHKQIDYLEEIYDIDRFMKSKFEQAKILADFPFLQLNHPTEIKREGTRQEQKYQDLKNLQAQIA